MGILSVTKVYKLPCLVPQSVLAEAKSQLIQLLKSANMDILVEQDTISFAGNMMSFIHNSFDNLNGEIEFRAQDNYVEITYSLSFLGQAIFAGMVCIIALLGTIKTLSALFLLIFPLVFSLQLRSAYTMFSSAIESTLYKIERNHKHH